jgi:hypothetical protein
MNDVLIFVALSSMYNTLFIKFFFYTYKFILIIYSLTLLRINENSFKIIFNYIYYIIT